MKIRLKKRVVMHKTPDAESKCFYAKWQIEDLGTICKGTPILGAFQEAPKDGYKFDEFNIEWRI
jgi:hypothetical protein